MLASWDREGFGLPCSWLRPISPEPASKYPMCITRIIKEYNMGEQEKSSACSHILMIRDYTSSAKSNSVVRIWVTTTDFLIFHWFSNFYTQSVPFYIQKRTMYNKSVYHSNLDFNWREIKPGICYNLLHLNWKLSILCKLILYILETIDSIDSIY